MNWDITDRVRLFTEVTVLGPLRAVCLVRVEFLFRLEFETESALLSFWACSDMHGNIIFRVGLSTEIAVFIVFLAFGFVPW